MTRKGLNLLLSFAVLLLFGVESARAQLSIGPQGPEDGVIRRQSWLIPAQDRITLMRTSVFRPQGAGPFPLAVIAHGSTQNEIRRAGFRQPQYTALTEWLVARGYAVAVPLRPGHGETGGPYYEAQGGCANADFAKAGQGAASGIEAAIDFLARQAFVRKTGAVALGHSAGGWGALALSTHALRPLAGVVAFAPGLGGRIDDAAGKTARRTGSSPRQKLMARRRACRRSGSRRRTTVISRRHCRSGWSMHSARAAAASPMSCCPQWDRMGTN